MTDRHLELAPPPPDHPTTHTPPHDTDAERQALAAMLYGDKQALHDVTTTITANDYYHPRHELIHQAITHLYARGITPDPTTVTNQLRDTGNLTRAGGHTYLTDLIQDLITPANAGYHADTILENATRRRILTTLDQARATLLTPNDTTPTQLLNHTRTLLDNIPTTPPGVDPTTTHHPWQPIDPTPVLDGTWNPPQATILTRRDGKHLLYPGAVHSIAGEPGSLKTWVALIATVQQLAAGNNVAMLDFEDNIGPVITRLQALGAHPNHIRTHFRYLRPDTALDDTGQTHLLAATHDTTLTIIDGITEAMSIHGMSINDNDDVARFLNLLPRKIADQCPAVLQIDHVTKATDTRGRYAIGGQHKLAAITGTALKAVVVKALAKGDRGQVKLVIDKDKHGDVGPAGTTIADLHIDATNPTGTLLAWLEPPGRSTDEEGHFRPTILMGRVSELLDTHGGLTMRGIRDMVRGKNTAISEAVHALTREGYIRVENGYYHSVEPYREDTK